MTDQWAHSPDSDGTMTVLEKSREVVGGEGSDGDDELQEEEGKRDFVWGWDRRGQDGTEKFRMFIQECYVVMLT